MKEKKKMEYEKKLKIVMGVILLVLINTYTTIFYFVSLNSKVKNSITQGNLESGFAMNAVLSSVEADKYLLQSLTKDSDILDAVKNPTKAENIATAFKQLNNTTPFTTGQSISVYSSVNDVVYSTPTNTSYAMPANKRDAALQMCNLSVPYTLEVHPNNDGTNWMWIDAPVKDGNKGIGFITSGAPVTTYVTKVLAQLNDSSKILIADQSYNVIDAKDKDILSKGSTIGQLFGETVQQQIDTAIKNRKDSGNIVISSSTGVYVVSLVPYINFVILSYNPIKVSDIFTGKANATVWCILILLCLINGGLYVALTKFNKLRETEMKLGSDLMNETQNLVVATKETAATSQDQSAAVKEIVATMEDSNALSENISQKIKDVSEVADKTTSDVGDGAAALTTNVDKLHEIFEANQQTIDGIKVLGDKIENIWDIVTLINNVADQAKIIAFNAELEAASAGEAGKNFHIVASEIRRLADSIIDGTKEIKEKINEIQQSSDSLILASESGTEKINEGCEAANELEKKFNSIRSAAEITAASANQITDIIQQQTVGSGQILITLKQIAAGVENFTAATENISTSAQNLKGIAVNLNKSVASTGRENGAAAESPVQE